MTAFGLLNTKYFFPFDEIFSFKIANYFIEDIFKKGKIIFKIIN